MRYYHHKRARAVYAVNEPVVNERDGHWNISADVEITRADNYLTKNRWKYDTGACPRESYYQKNYSKESALGYFFSTNINGFGESVSKEEYEKFRDEYAAEAGANEAPEK